MERIAEFALRHRALVVLFWLAAVVGGVMAAGPTVNNLSTDFTVPGQPGFETSKAINEALGETDNGPTLPLLTVPEGQTVDSRRADIEAFWNTLRTDHPEWRVADWTTSNNDAFVTKDRRSTFAMVYGPMPKSFTDLPFGLQIVEQYGEQNSDPNALKVGGTGYFELAVSDQESGGGEGTGFCSR